MDWQGQEMAPLSGKSGPINPAKMTFLFLFLSILVSGPIMVRNGMVCVDTTTLP